MGFIQSNHSRILFNSTMISFNVRRTAAHPQHASLRLRKRPASLRLFSYAAFPPPSASSRLLPSSSQVAEAARAAGIKRIWYASSACIYPESKQTDENLGGASGLKEDDAWPAQPQA